MAFAGRVSDGPKNGREEAQESQAGGGRSRRLCIMHILLQIFVHLSIPKITGWRLIRANAAPSPPAPLPRRGEGSRKLCSAGRPHGHSCPCAAHAVQARALARVRGVARDAPARIVPPAPPRTRRGRGDDTGPMDENRATVQPAVNGGPDTPTARKGHEWPSVGRMSIAFEFDVGLPAPRPRLVPAGD